MSRLSLRTLLLCGALCAAALRAQPLLLPGTCSFEFDTCGYRSEPSPDSWRINVEGHLISVDSAFLDGLHNSAVLSSPVLEHRDWSCVRLVYQITGHASLQLLLRLHGDNFDHLLWTANQTSDSWLIASVDLSNTSVPYQVMLAARPGGGSGNSVAVFEIHILPGYCMECNFEEHHLCGYSNTWNPNVNWYVGGTTSREPQQTLNHSTHEQRGHFMYVDSVYAKHFQEVATLSSPMTTVAMEGCLSFYYFRDQERGSIFWVFTRDQLGHYEEVWSPPVYVTTGWTLGSVDIKAPHPMEVVFEVAFNSARGGYVAIDDISFSPEFCHTDTEPTFDPSLANCDFERGLCRYQQERAEGEVWSRVSVKPNVHTVGDHSTGAGHFLLANTRFSSIPGYVGRLHGPFLPGNHKYCLRFYYLLYGFGKVDGGLVLYVYDENDVAQERVWILSETSRGVWTEAEITYMKPMTSKVVFVSICRDLWECGLIAIDDITVSLGDCQMTSGSLPGQCNFESGLCGYTQDKPRDKAEDKVGDKARVWLRVRGHTPTSYTGPRGDHTTGGGHFMHIEASLMRPGDRARLLTSDLRGSSSPQCLTFYYHMYGSGTGILSVWLRRSATLKDELLWRRRGEQSMSWMRAMVDYGCPIRHQIVFEATRGPTLRSDIALDDVMFKRGPCEDPGDFISHSGFSEDFNHIEM